MIATELTSCWNDGKKVGEKGGEKERVRWKRVEGRRNRDCKRGRGKGSARDRERGGG